MFTRSIHRALRSSPLRTTFPSRTFTHLPLSRPIPQCTTRQIPLRATERRNYASRTPRGLVSMTWHNWKRLWRADPFTMTIFGGILIAGLGTTVAIVFHYFYYLAPMDARYPEPVSKKLRQALWYMNVEPDPQRSLNCFQEAIKLAQQHGQHPFSVEVMGIKIKIVELLVHFGDPAQAVSVCEIIRRECEEFIDGPHGKDITPEHREQLIEIIWQSSFKIGELYGGDALQDTEAAEKNLIRGFELSMKQRLRREALERDTLANATEPTSTEKAELQRQQREQVGAAAEQLANHFEAQSKHHLAAPLYLRALSDSPRNCHAVLLMNNLSSSLAQTQPDSGSDVAAMRESLIANAQAWALKALALAADIKPPLRDADCDTSCAVATHNLGEFAEMQEKWDEAKRRYEEAEALAKAIEFQDGVKHAREALKRIEKLRAGL